MGEVFAGRYELVDQIGQGGMGSVWRVIDHKRDQVLAAKLLRQADAGTLLRFMREQGVRIQHPNVVTPIGWAGADNEVLFTMPLVDGGSVAGLLARYGALPPRYCAELVRQLLDGLAAVHAQRVVHRDVKPANMLLAATGTDRPHVWLTDFGVAVSQDDARLTAHSVVFGTPGYLAPEQLCGADPDPRSDLYAVGQVGAQLLSGHAPHQAEAADAAAGAPELPDDTPPELVRFVRLMCDPDVGGRPATAGAARALLDGPDLAWEPQTRVEVRSQLAPMGAQGGEFAQVRPTVASPELTQSVESQPDGSRPDSTQRFGGHTSVLGAPGTARLAGSRAPARGMPPGRGTASPTASGMASAARRRAPVWALVAMILAPLLALGVVGAILLTWPRTSGGTAPPAGMPVAGAQCSWSDVGQSANGLRCTADGSDQYTWTK